MSSSSTAGGLPIVVSGRVEEGVEHGSVVLRDDGGRVWQLGRAGRAHVGRRVRVTGRPRTGMMTTAQQGTPFEVLTVEVERAGPVERAGDADGETDGDAGPHRA